MCFQGAAEAFRSPRIQRRRPEHEMMSISPAQTHWDAATQRNSKTLRRCVNVLYVCLFMCKSECNKWCRRKKKNPKKKRVSSCIEGKKYWYNVSFLFQDIAVVGMLVKLYVRNPGCSSENTDMTSWHSRYILSFATLAFSVIYLNDWFQLESGFPLKKQTILIFKKYLRLLFCISALIISQIISQVVKQYYTTHAICGVPRWFPALLWLILLSWFLPMISNEIHVSCRVQRREDMESSGVKTLHENMRITHDIDAKCAE